MSIFFVSLVFTKRQLKKIATVKEEVVGLKNEDGDEEQVIDSPIAIGFLELFYLPQ